MNQPTRHSPSQTRTPVRRAGVAALTALTVFALVIAGSLATADAKPAKRSAVVRPAEPALDKTGAPIYRFHLSKEDRAALASHRKATRVEKRAEAARVRAAQLEDRIADIQDLLDEAQGEEARLRAALEARLVQQYKAGSGSSWAFLLTASTVGDMVDRAGYLHDSQTREDALAESHRISVADIEQLQIALEQLRDVDGERAAQLEQRALELNEELGAARSTHMEASTQLTGEGAASGTWLVSDPNWNTLSGLSSFAGSLGGAYDGGTRTPREKSTPEQAARVLGDPRIQIYAGGIADIRAGMIDGRLLDAISAVAEQFGQITITSLRTGHGTYTTSGNISEHSFGCAADIGTVNNIVIQPSTQGPGTITEKATLFLAGLQGRLAPHQVITLNSYGGPTLAMADHYDHIHLGYSC